MNITFYVYSICMIRNYITISFSLKFLSFHQQQQHGLGFSKGLIRLHGLKLYLLNSKIFFPSFTWASFVSSVSGYGNLRVIYEIYFAVFLLGVIATVIIFTSRMYVNNL
jgi:hypothetical protein